MKKHQLFDYLLQLLMVILGVFLGMMASEWSSDRSREEDKNNLLTGLKHEISDNLQYLKSRKEHDLIPFFNSLDSLTNTLEGQPEILDEPFRDEPFLNRIPNFPSLGRPKLDDAMYDAAKYSNMLANFDVEVLQQLTKVYNLQSNLHAQRTYLDLKLTAIDTDTKYKEVISLMWEVMESYFGAQYNLIKEYKKALELL